MSENIVVEELILKPIGDSEDAPSAYCIVVNGKHSPLYFSRRQAEEALANTLAELADTR